MKRKVTATPLDVDFPSEKGLFAWLPLRRHIQASQSSNRVNSQCTGTITIQ